MRSKRVLCVVGVLAPCALSGAACGDNELSEDGRGGGKRLDWHDEQRHGAADHLAGHLRPIDIVDARAVGPFDIQLRHIGVDGWRWRGNG